MKIKDVAEAFANGAVAKCVNANTDGTTYWLHGNCIAKRTPDGLMYDWCGWHGPTTRNHLNKIAQAFRYGRPFGYALFRDFAPDSGYFKNLPPAGCDKEVFKAHFELRNGVAL